MAQRTGLGKGLDALIPAGGKIPPSVSAGSGSGVQQVSVDVIQRKCRVLDLPAEVGLSTWLCR